MITFDDALYRAIRENRDPADLAKILRAVSESLQTIGQNPDCPAEVERMVDAAADWDALDDVASNLDAANSRWIKLEPSA